MLRAIILFILSLLSIQMFAQDDIVNRIVYVRHLVSDSADYNPKEALCQLQLMEKDCMVSDNDTLKGVYLELKGQALYSLERYKECVAPCKEAIRLFERCNLRQYEYLDAFQIIAMAYHRMGDFENAESYYRKGLIRSVAAKVSTTGQYKADMFLNLGNLYKTKGDSVLAENAFGRSQQLSDSVFDVGKWNYIDWENACWDKIDQLRQAGMYQETVDVYSEMISGIQKNRGKDKTYLLAVYSKAILLSRYLGKFDEAIPLYKEVVENGENSSSTAESVCGAYCNLAQCYAYKGEFPKTDEVIQESQSCLSRANNEYYPPHAVYRFAGNGAYWTKNYEKAIKYYEIYLSPKYQREKGTNYEDIVTQVSVSYIQSDTPEKAKSLLSSFLKSDEARMKKDNISSLATIYHNLGRAYMLTGYKSDALKYLNKSKDLQTKLYGKVLERTLQYINECVVK